MTKCKSSTALEQTRPRHLGRLLNYKRTTRQLPITIERGCPPKKPPTISSPQDSLVRCHDKSFLSSSSSCSNVEIFLPPLLLSIIIIILADTEEEETESE